MYLLYNIYLFTLFIFYTSIPQHPYWPFTSAFIISPWLRPFIFVYVCPICYLLAFLIIYLFTCLYLLFIFNYIIYFRPLHECVHMTAFGTPFLNRMGGFFTGLATLRPPFHYKLYHFAHHRYTGVVYSILYNILFVFTYLLLLLFILEQTKGSRTL